MICQNFDDGNFKGEFGDDGGFARYLGYLEQFKHGHDLEGSEELGEFGEFTFLLPGQLAQEDESLFLVRIDEEDIAERMEDESSKKREVGTAF